jgi:hypothetical protein
MWGWVAGEVSPAIFIFSCLKQGLLFILALDLQNAHPYFPVALKS